MSNEPGVKRLSIQKIKSESRVQILIAWYKKKIPTSHQHKINTNPYIVKVGLTQIETFAWQSKNARSPQYYL